jgi:MFS family permease
LKSKFWSVIVLVSAEMAGMSLWFMSAAILPDILRETAISVTRQALLSSSVQAGFVVGALVISMVGIADRLDPRKVFAACAVAAAAANLSILFVDPGGLLAILARFATGALLAGVYPVGMKIAVGWGNRDRGLLIGMLVGALTFGKSVPYLAAWIGGADWRSVTVLMSAVSASGGLLVLFVGLGPLHARAPRFEFSAIRLAWTDISIRRAYIGYLGHMWELFAMWAWIAAAAAASYSYSMDDVAAHDLGKLTAFLAISIGAIFCIPAGWAADRIGKAEVTVVALTISGLSAIATAAVFGGPPWLTLILVVIWGLAVIPDSAQFSAIVADHAPPHQVGSLLTFQTALGFTLTIATVQLTPLAASAFGWPAVLAGLAIGPAIAIAAMMPMFRRWQIAGEMSSR